MHLMTSTLGPCVSRHRGTDTSDEPNVGLREVSEDILSFPGGRMHELRAKTQPSSANSVIGASVPGMLPSELSDKGAASAE